MDSPKMKLSEIEPITLSSLIRRNWRADIPLWIVAGVICAPPALLGWSNLWVYVIVAAVASFLTEAGMSRLREHWRFKEAMTMPSHLPEPIHFDVIARASTWSELFAGSPVKSFVIFSYGTCVVLIQDNLDPEAEAKALLQRYGHAIPGTQSADMFVYELPGSGGFVIGCHHPNIMTFVSRDSLPEGLPADKFDAYAAFLGRDLRVWDTFTLSPVYTHKVS